jgi:Protein of unknown function (DUF3466)
MIAQRKNVRSNRLVGLAWAAGVVAGSVTHAMPIYGGPSYDSTTGTGYQTPDLSYTLGSTAGHGMAVGSAFKYGANTNLGLRALRWYASETAATELGHLGTNSSGFTNSYVGAVSAAGTAVGFAEKYRGNLSLGNRAVRWDVSGTVATELSHLGVDSSGYTSSSAHAVNAAGTAVGYADKRSSGINVGSRAVRWDASGTAATELGTLGTDSSGYNHSRALALNTTGTVFGVTAKYVGNTWLGNRAVRWDASGTAATELGTLGTKGGITNSYVYAVNDAGTAVGYAQQYSNGTFVGDRAVRWDASGTAASELGHLGTPSDGVTYSYAYDINAAGTAVGYTYRYNNWAQGARAVRWDASGTAATELGNLGTDTNGFSESRAFAVNIFGTAVGFAVKYKATLPQSRRAVAWGLDGVALDLNTLLSPSDAVLWRLTEARGISDTGWITGYGMFDPDGEGGLSAYQRAFLIQLPEPASILLLAVGTVRLLARRR